MATHARRPCREREASVAAKADAKDVDDLLWIG